MKKALYISFLSVILLTSSCQSQEKIDNTKPMYGEVEKSEDYKKIDELFIQDCINEYGSIDSSFLVHIDYAWRYYYHNDLELAMKRFNQAWLLNPELPDTYFGFASLLETNGEYENAKHFYKIGKEKDNLGQSEKIFQRIADCKENLRDIKGTIQAYEKIVLLNPKNSFAYKKIGYFQMSLGNVSEAILAYDKAITLDPNDAMTFNNRAYLYQQTKEYELAIIDYTASIELNPNYISALVNRGITYMELKEFAKAKKDFEKTTKLDPKSGELRRILGLANLSLNKNDEACEDFNIALSLGDETVKELILENCN